MTIKYWTSFSKRKNSTKQPTTGWTLATMKLKEGTSIESPVFLLSGDLFDITYVNAFNHYYFVTDIRSVRNGLTEIYCKMDPLASFKSDIGSYTALIERSDSFYTNSYPDPAVSVKNEIVSDYVEVDPGLFDSEGCFVVSVLNNVGSGTGFTTSYAFTKTALQTLAKYVNTDWGSMAADILSWLQATFLHTAASVIDCIWLPLSYSFAAGDPIVSEQVVIGVDAVSYQGNPVYASRFTGAYVKTASVSGTIPHHYTTSGDFRRSAPYTTGKLFIPGYGTADFNPIDFEPSGKVNFTYSVDLSTGDAVCYVSNDDGVLVSSYNFNIGVSCPVGKVGANVTETIGGVLNTASNIAIFNAADKKSLAGISADYASASSAVNALASAAGVTASYSGRKGGRATWKDNKKFAIEMFAHLTQDPTSMEATSGRPDMTERVISTCSGFVKCINASVPINGMDAERDEINSFLNSGFYYE